MSQIAPPFSFLAILGRFPEAGIPAQLYIKSKEGAGTVVGLNMNIIRFIRCVFKPFFLSRNITDTKNRMMLLCDDT